MFFRARPPRAAPPAPTRQMHIPLRLPDGRVVEVRRVHHASVRGLRLTVTERGIRLTVPPRTSDRRALAFVESHAAWVAGQLGHTFGDVEPLRIGASDCLQLRGESVPLQWHDGRFLRIEMGDAGIVATLPPNAPATAVRRGFRDFYLAQARADVGRWLPRYLPGLPCAPKSIAILPLTSLWGSLTVNDRMRLDLALVIAPSAAFEYVLVHELCHLLQPNHSPAFWDEVAKRSPDWQLHRDFLRKHGRPIKAGLRAVCEMDDSTSPATQHAGSGPVGH